MKSTKMKLFGVSCIVLLCLNSSMTVESIGNLNMVSTINVDSSKRYELITKCQSLTKKELRKTGRLTIQDAIDQAMRRDTTRQGEYLMNARVYLVTKDFVFCTLQHYYAEGDVWVVKK